MELNKSDLESWTEFTNRNAFDHGISYLRDHRLPAIARSANPHEMAYDAGKVAGYLQALTDLKNLGVINRAEKSAERPGLEVVPVS